MLDPDPYQMNTDPQPWYKDHNFEGTVTYLAEWIVVLAKEWEGEVMIDKDHEHGRQKGGRTHGEEGKAGQQGEVRHLH